MSPSGVPGPVSGAAKSAAADIAVAKVQPLGGVRACLQIAERIGLPVVVSSALETSIGIRAGIALAAALPDLPHARAQTRCAAAGDDLAREPLTAVAGMITVSDLTVDRSALDRHRPAVEVQQFWQSRLDADSGAGSW
jgi:O-succinylbenzoate synthase